MDESTAERWLPVVGGENCYEISDCCRVRSLYRPGLILKPSYSNSGGYALYVLTINGRKVGKYGHRLMMEAFVGPCPPGLQVRHLDGNCLNNVLSNLAYGTPKENQADRRRDSGHHHGDRDRCSKGHLFTPENTRIRTRPDGSFLERLCKECDRETSRAYLAKKRATAGPCTVEGCDRRQFAKGLCGPHYSRQRDPRS